MVPRSRIPLRVSAKNYGKLQAVDGEGASLLMRHGLRGNGTTSPSLC